MDRMMFITVKGSEFESIAYNQHKTALKSVESDLEKICESYENECGDETVKIQLGDARKLIYALDKLGVDTVNISFDIEDNTFLINSRNQDIYRKCYHNLPTLLAVFLIKPF